ncbi:dual specificity protein phosphatase family protein [Idiomarina xiamenensis]|uniref:Dual specificity protein phosphatase n=1 Tax=Idiomarina xiamenensis 10-D-4 TaxID=740709 RepID=K2KHU4_9GAMM|nr:dual specificity protein phosphatase [Idiomarina xiamenensis]EKE87533.1 dual specificity protein phosphatase [Idiomarina xiamenensis 10-D-4]
MLEVYPKLFVGNDTDASVASQESSWFIIHACKEPYHRQALGYSGRAAPKGHPEYLIAKRENRLILNLIDANDPNYIPKVVIDEAIDTIHGELKTNKVLVHCNQGMSRSPTIALLYLLKHTDALPKDNLNLALEKFRELYPKYTPAKGVALFVQFYWQVYAG